MVAVGAGEREVEKELRGSRGSVVVAAVNAEDAVVIAGDESEVMEVSGRLERRGVRVKRLEVSHAFHSPRMEPMLKEYRKEAERVEYRRKKIPMVSTVSGEEAGEEVETAEYWVRQVREAVRFAGAVKTLKRQGVQEYLEIGPRAALLGMIRAEEGESEPVRLGSMKSGMGESEALLEAVGGYYVRGGQVKWSGVFGKEWRRVELPTYPWQRKRYWMEEGEKESTREPESELEGKEGRWRLSGGGVRMPGGNEHHVLRVGKKRPEYLGDHVVYGEVVVPGAFHLGVVLSLGEKKWGESGVELSGVEFPQALVVEGEEELHTVLMEEGEGYRFEVASPRKEGEGWRVHAQGVMRRLQEKEQWAGPEGKRVGEEEVQGEELVEKLSGKQIEWGPRWRWIEKVQRWEGGAEGVLRGPEGEEREEGPVHPAMLDNGFAVALSAAMEEMGEEPKLPWGVERIRMRRRARGRVRCEAVLRRSWEEGATADLRMVEEGVGTVLEVEGFTVRRAPREAFLGKAGSGEAGLYRVKWEAVGKRGEERVKGMWIGLAYLGLLVLLWII